MLVSFCHTHTLAATPRPEQRCCDSNLLQLQMTVKYFTEPVSSECPGGCAARAGWLMRCVVHIVGASTPTATTTSNRLPARPVTPGNASVQLSVQFSQLLLTNIEKRCLLGLECFKAKADISILTRERQSDKQFHRLATVEVRG